MISTYPNLSKLSRRDLTFRRREIIDSMKYHFFRARGYSPHRYQLTCHTNQARNRNSFAGRRGGKTRWTAEEAASYMLGPYRICLLGPTYNDVYKEFRDIRDAVQHPSYPYFIERLVDNKDAGNLVIKTSVGAELEARSAANMGKSPVIGEEYDLMVLSEGARINGLGGEGGLWESQLRGNLTTRLGDTILPTTPAGKDNWVYPRFMDGLKGINNQFSIQWAAYANPEYYEDIAQMYRIMSRRAFREQVLGDFVSWTGAIWVEDCGWNPAEHYIRSFVPPLWWKRVEIIDPGWSDNLAWIAAVIDHKGRIYVVDEFTCRKTSYEQIAEMIIMKRQQLYYPQPAPANIPVYVDPEDPRCAAEISKAALEMDARILCTAANNDVNNGFLMASARIRSGEFYVTNNCPQFADALSNHEWSNRENSRGKVEQRDKYKHFSDCGRYLQLVPITASQMPQPLEIRKPTFKDILDEQHGDFIFGAEFERFLRTHREAA